MTALQTAAKYSTVNVERLTAMQDALNYIDDKRIDGDIVECGVWRGGHIIMARLLSPARRCWLYDTFAGMTEPTREDVTRGGKEALKIYRAKKTTGGAWREASLSDVKENFVREGLYDETLLRFVVGDVCRTLRIAENIPDEIALLRLDTDWYESTKIELDVLFPRLQVGGVIVVDDYGHWQGAKKAVDEYFARRSEKFSSVDYSAIMTVKDG